MRIQVNGELMQLDPAAEGARSISSLLGQLGYRGETFAVALNGDFVARADYSQTQLAEGDALDIVAPVVGG